jgi:hypothetical protein
VNRTTSFLQFIDHPPKAPRTTVIVHVRSRRTTEMLGQIKWYSHWRQYAFFPEPGTIWNTQCLDEIQAEIKTLMEARRD